MPVADLQTYPCAAYTVAEARAWVNKSIADDCPRADDAEMIVSELCTNAVVHSFQPSVNSYKVAYHLDKRHLLLQVTNQARPGRYPQLLDADGLAIGHRGLRIVETLTEGRWKYERISPTGIRVSAHLYWREDW